MSDRVNGKPEVLTGQALYRHLRREAEELGRIFITLEDDLNFLNRTFAPDARLRDAVDEACSRAAKVVSKIRPRRWVSSFPLEQVLAIAPSAEAPPTPESQSQEHRGSLATTSGAEPREDENEHKP